VNEDARQAREMRLLVLAPTTRDGELTQAMLDRAGIACECFSDLETLCDVLDLGAGGVLFPEEAVEQGRSGRLARYLAAQPAWSDLPVLVLARPGAVSADVARAMDLFGNVTVLERPMRVAALVSAVRSALRARQRQYQLRDHLLQRERTEQLLRQSVEEMQTLLETLPIGVFIAHDPECRRITGNRSASELLRISSGENLSKTAAPSEIPVHFRVCRDGIEVPARALPMQRAARGERVRRETLDQVFDDGTVVNTVVSAMPLFDADDRPRGAVGAIMDVTELKRSEIALRDADRRKDEFLAILAHELRNPLAPIRNSLHLLRLTSPHDPATRRMGEMMERQVEVMVRLVDDLLEVSRITRGTISLRKEGVEATAAVRRAIEANRALIEAAGHRLVLDFPAEPLDLDADPVRLDQVIANLLNNAAKYTDPGGEIRVAVSREGNAVAIAVRDTGVGIAPEKLPKVFDLFMQIEPHGQRAQGGLGIGLTLVKRLVELHGGRVEAHSEGHGHGSEFVVRLPLAAKAGHPMQIPAATAESRPRKARRVLVVDDNRDAAESLALLLGTIGAEARVENSGPDALVTMAVYQPVIVMLDIGMPGMDGHEVARRIREQREYDDVLLVALTGWGQEEDRRRSRGAGFDHHLTKPAALADLQALLGQVGERDRGHVKAI
jgi:signal transduction histidine kinase/ActR/RegA family two-component response regulator